MRVLVVDDDAQKSARIEQMLEKCIQKDGRIVVTRAETLADAVRNISSVQYDLIFIDLMLPYFRGGRVESHAGVELLRQVRSEEGLNKTTRIIAISAYPAEVEQHREKFEGFGVLILNYEEGKPWEAALSRLVSEVTVSSPIRIELDFIIICALEEEKDGFTSTAFSKISDVVVSGLNVRYVRMQTADGLFGAIIRLRQMGLVCATRETTLALTVFRTKVICMTGICAGFSTQVNLGQLVIASPAWEYQAGKWSDNGFEIAPTQIPLRPDTRSIIDQTVSADGFVSHLESGLGTQRMKRPTQQLPPLLAPFTTGSAVIADPARLENIQAQHRKVAALDMETFGVYYASFESSFVVEHFFSIKCVVDLADTAKSDDLHEYGCAISARAAEKIICRLFN